MKNLQPYKQFIYESTGEILRNLNGVKIKNGNLTTIKFYSNWSKICYIMTIVENRGKSFVTLYESTKLGFKIY